MNTGQLPRLHTGRNALQIIALLLMLGSALVMARKVLGAMLLAVGGLGLAVQTCCTACLAYLSGPETLWISAYYVAFWLPAAALSMVCGAALVRPALRVLRRRCLDE